MKTKPCSCLIIIPSYWFLTDAGEEGQELNPDVERIFIESVLTARAFESIAAVTFCNAGRLSSVNRPILGTLGEIEIGKDKVEIVEVNLDILRIAEDNYKIRKDIKGEGWYYKYDMNKRA
ncbi:hypothetical protein Forpe1208_v010590 [Fusarium oxysporum f. sp. rapae]|uniref:Uncharacterized protein n=1 Tax=Fusarium oxysporum f. sp. rapae TaxID=485398 RepID=A0A8J5TTU2_FUSOX|nr:hypothetical protein Forpe1208_v010590 [Fusarium oxysporum f. sp. rapae]